MKQNARLERLFESIPIGGMKLKNRIVMSPMVVSFAGTDGLVTERTLAYYEERAKGGAGMVIVEGTCIDSPIGRISRRQLIIDDDRFVPGLSELAKSIKRHGAKAAVQLLHAGASTSSATTGVQPVGPSAVPLPGREIPRGLALREISEIVKRFAKAAGRAKKAGFDGIEIHAAHELLITEFLSSAYNKRQDKYGGSLVNRARLLLEIIEATKAEVGKSYPLWCRITARQFGLEGGITIEEAQAVSRMVEEAGLDAIHVSAYAPQKRGALVRFAEAVKSVVSIPIITVGRIDPALGEEILSERKADIIAIGRGLLADPYLPQKAAEGRLEDIRPCIGCGKCMTGNADKVGVSCTVNPALGKEREYAITPAAKPKRIVVIGGGPAGMEAARVAAWRGNKVTLFEKEAKLGGQLNVAAVPPSKGELSDLNSYLATQVQKAGVKTKLGKKATASGIKKMAPDAVILAAGVTPFIPEIPGIERENVVVAEEVLAGRTRVGEKVVVVGGEMVGCETAEYLSEMGKRVAITRRGPVMAATMPLALGQPLVARLKAKGVAMLTGVKYHEVNDEGLVITTAEGEKRTIPADTIVLAAGSKPNAELLLKLRESAPEIRQVGDCVKPRGIQEALSEGWQAALSL